MFSHQTSPAASRIRSLLTDYIARRRRLRARTVGAVATLALCAGLTATAFAQGGRGAGAVFVGTNHNNTLDPNEPPNQVAMYRRDARGGLTLRGYFDTGGQGSGPASRVAGNSLGSAHSVQLSEDRRFLFVTNAGSDNVSVFRVWSSRLTLTDVAPTGDGSPGQRYPNSVTQRGDLVYVLNSAGQGSITGFWLSRRGTLTPIPGSTRSLDANQTYPPDTLFNPTQVSFTPDGRQLVVTIKDGPPAGPTTGPGRVLVFNVGADGRPSAAFTQTGLNNAGPFGFSFDARGNLLVALFAIGAVGSFQIGSDGMLTAITPIVSGGGVLCWLENNGRYAYGTNYAAGTIASYVIGRDGSLRLLAAVAGIADHPGNTQGPTPLDIGISPDGKFLYVVLPGSGRVGGWFINSDGSLTKLGEFGGLPQTVDGDMAPEERFGPGGSPAGIAVL